MYWTKPVVGGASDIMDTPNNGSCTQSHSTKRKRAGLEPNWTNVPSEPGKAIELLEVTCLLWEMYLATLCFLPFESEWS